MLENLPNSAARVLLGDGIHATGYEIVRSNHGSHLQGQLIRVVVSFVPEVVRIIDMNARPIGVAGLPTSVCNGHADDHIGVVVAGPVKLAPVACE